MKKPNLEKLKKEASELISKTEDLKTLENLEIKFLGRKDGEITKIMRGLANMSLAQKKKLGPEANDAKKSIEEMILRKRNELLGKTRPQFDYTLPPKELKIGHLPPITQFMKKVSDCFISMGFEIADGPEVEMDKYNFDALNIPKDHPARDMWDTFYIKNRKNLLLLF